MCTAEISNDEYIYIKSAHMANTWACALIQKHDSTRDIYIGINIEWNIYDKDNITCLLQVSFPNDKVAVINLIIMNSVDSRSFPDMVRTLLELPMITVRGKNIGIDCAWLQKTRS